LQCNQIRTVFMKKKTIVPMVATINNDGWAVKDSELHTVTVLGTVSVADDGTPILLGLLSFPATKLCPGTEAEIAFAHEFGLY